MTRQSNDKSHVSLSPLYLRSLTELYVLVAGWLFFAAWTMTVCWWLAYPEKPSNEVTTLLGMPSWVVWGVLLPWVTAGLFTVWFSLFFLRDDDEAFQAQLKPSQGDLEGVAHE